MKQKTIIILIALVVILGGVTVYYVWKEYPNKKVVSETIDDVETINYGPPQPSDKVQQSAKDEVINGTRDQSGKPTGEPTALRVTITQATQQERTVYIRSLVDGATSGSCNVVVKKGDSAVEKTALLGVQASYAICQGFNIPVEEFSESGEWQVTLTVTDASGQRATTTTSLKVTP